MTKLFVDVKKLKSPVYISGPITGKPEGNKEAFSQAEQHLKDLGYQCVNPRNLEIPFCLRWEKRNPCRDIDIVTGNEKLWNWMMKRSLFEMMECNSVLLLNDWENSKGAYIEYQLAVILGLPYSQLK